MLTPDAEAQTSFATKVKHWAAAAYEAVRWPFREDAAFSLLVLAVFFVPLAFSPLSREGYDTIKLTVLLLTVGGSLLVLALRKTTSIRFHAGFIGLIVLFWFLVAVSTARSLDVVNSLVGHYRFADTFLFMTLWAIFLVLFTGLLTKLRFWFVVKGLTFVALITSIYGLIQTTGFYYYDPNNPVFFRAPSFLGNPNFASMLVVSIFPLTLFLATKAKTFYSRLYYYLTSVAIVGATIGFGSRGALVGLLAGCLVGSIIAALTRHWKLALHFIATLLIALGFAVWFLSIFRPGVAADTLNQTDINVSSRLYVWHEAEGIIRQHPWTGVGLENFLLAFQQNRGGHLAGAQPNFDDPHNLLLLLVSELGIPATVVFALLVGLALTFGLRRLRTEDFPTTLALYAGLTAFFATSLFTPVPISLWLLLAVFLAGLSYDQGVLKIGRPVVPYRILLGLFGAACLLWAVCFVSAEYMYYQANEDYTLGRYQEAMVLFRLTTKLNPTEQEFWSFRAYSELYAGQPASVVAQSLQVMQRMHPNEESVIRHAGDLYLILFERTGNKDYLTKAIANGKTAVDYDPQAGLHYLYLFRYYYTAGLHREARAYLLRTISTGFNDFRAWLLLARVYQQEGNRANTLAAIKNAFDLAPDDNTLRSLWHLSRVEKDINKLPLNIPLRFAGLD